MGVHTLVCILLFCEEKMSKHIAIGIVLGVLTYWFISQNYFVVALLFSVYLVLGYLLDEHYKDKVNIASAVVFGAVPALLAAYVLLDKTSFMQVLFTGVIFGAASMGIMMLFDVLDG